MLYYPQCLSCKRLELHCSFSSPTLATMPIHEDSLADLELLDYWDRHPLLPGSLERDRELRHANVRLGFSYPYLLNSILAVMSLRRFVAHQQAAISRSRPHFQCLDSPHHKAILAFSTFTSLYAVAEPLHRPTSLYHKRSKFDPIEEFVHAVRLSRASTAFVQHLRAVTASDAFMATKYSPNKLEVVMTINHIMVLFAWIKEVDSIFWDMCSARHPVALIILGHFAALMSLRQGFWLIQHWSSVLSRFIREQTVLLVLTEDEQRHHG
ncbi:hypothetical protein BDW62DRAFT_212799 [Aspergillus aurantiobrunneus]